MPSQLQNRHRMHSDDTFLAKTERIQPLRNEEELVEVESDDASESRMSKIRVFDSNRKGLFARK